MHQHLASGGGFGEQHAQLRERPYVTGPSESSRYGQALTLPAPEAAVIQFLVDHLARRSRTGLR